VRISAQIRDDDDTFELRVSDTGPGIPDDRFERIFEKFHQVDSAMTRNFSGAGLGLYIVKTFVSLLAGTIDLKSTVGEGSVFTVRLPIKGNLAAVRDHENPALRPGFII
jgi:signal transduction histidine kinase